MSKKYYWIKLMDNFFRQKEIKKLRKIAGGDTFTIIYQEMMLLSLSNGGKLYFDEFGNDIADEIALELDESVDNVRVTINYLMSHGLMKVQDDGTEYTLEKVPTMIGSETSAAERMRRYREKKASKQLDDKSENVTLLQDGYTSRNFVTAQLRREDIEKREELEVDSSTSKNSYNPILEWEKKVGITITAYTAERIKYLFAEVGEYAYDKALKKAADTNKRNFSYIQAVARGIASGNDFSEKKKQPQQQERAIKPSSLTKEQEEVLVLMRELCDN